MGLIPEGMNLIEMAIGAKYPRLDLRMFEFGNQCFFTDEHPGGVSPTKPYFESLGIEHVSLDLNGRNNSLKRDITEDVSDLGQFDIVTNLGSSEHVSPLEKQYECFKNLHDLCNVGGYMIHHVPPDQTIQWSNHSPAFYKDHFFPILKELNNYKKYSSKQVNVYLTPPESTEGARAYTVWSSKRRMILSL